MLLPHATYETQETDESLPWKQEWRKTFEYIKKSNRDLEKNEKKYIKNFIKHIRKKEIPITSEELIYVVDDCPDVESFLSILEELKTQTIELKNIYTQENNTIFMENLYILHQRGLLDTFYDADNQITFLQNLLYLENTYQSNKNTLNLFISTEIKQDVNTTITQEVFNQLNLQQKKSKIQEIWWFEINNQSWPTMLWNYTITHEKATNDETETYLEYLFDILKRIPTSMTQGLETVHFVKNMQRNKIWDPWGFYIDGKIMIDIWDELNSKQNGPIGYDNSRKDFFPAEERGELERFNHIFLHEFVHYLDDNDSNRYDNNEDLVRENIQKPNNLNPKGFISEYAKKSPNEDQAELGAYLLNPITHNVVLRRCLVDEALREKVQLMLWYHFATTNTGEFIKDEQDLPILWKKLTFDEYRSFGDGETFLGNISFMPNWSSWYFDKKYRNTIREGSNDISFDDNEKFRRYHYFIDSILKDNDISIANNVVKLFWERIPLEIKTNNSSITKPLHINNIQNQETSIIEDLGNMTYIQRKVKKGKEIMEYLLRQKKIHEAYRFNLKYEKFLEKNVYN